jgi:hypothetical protein
LEELLEEPLQERDVDAVVLGVVAFVVGVAVVLRLIHDPRNLR